MVKQLIERILSPAQVERLHHRTSGIRARFYRHDLKKLARLFGSDKWGAHWYAEHYEHHFRPLQKRHLNVLEIGIGGENRPNSGGASLRMWASYFPHSAIHGIDICDKSFLQGGRIKVFQGSQADAPFLKKVIDEIGTPDIIIDDGSHLNETRPPDFSDLVSAAGRGWNLCRRGYPDFLLARHGREQRQGECVADDDDVF